MQPMTPRVRPGPQSTRQFVHLPNNATRVLLIHPPIYDIRIPWSRYVQPIRLMRLSTFFRNQGAEVRMIDAVAPGKGTTHRRQLAKVFTLDDHPINQWRFGISPAAIERWIRSLVRERWIPDLVYVECLTTFWWEGAAEVIKVVKTYLPDTHLALTGAYADFTPEHARVHTQADEVGTIDWRELACLAPDLTLYERLHDCIYLSLANGTRPAEEVVEEIALLQRNRRIQTFAFLDSGDSSRYIRAFRAVLRQIIEQNMRVVLLALGTIAMHDLIANPRLLKLMKRAGYRQICFADDRNLLLQPDADRMLIQNARLVAEQCHRVGYPLRSDAITASLCLGHPGESLTARAQIATQLAHHLGSLIFWPYQPAPDELPHVPLEEQNGKLFPLRSRNGANFDDYMSVLGLASVLNSKYRTETFDFLGNDLIAQLFQESLHRQAWEPPEEVKGSLKLPAQQL
jgi:hypothetical protein